VLQETLDLGLVGHVTRQPRATVLFWVTRFKRSSRRRRRRRMPVGGQRLGQGSADPELAPVRTMRRGREGLAERRVAPGRRGGVQGFGGHPNPSSSTPSLLTRPTLSLPQAASPRAGRETKGAPQSPEQAEDRVQDAADILRFTAFEPPPSVRRWECHLDDGKP